MVARERGEFARGGVRRASRRLVRAFAVGTVGALSGDGFLFFRGMPADGFRAEGGAETEREEDDGSCVSVVRARGCEGGSDAMRFRTSDVRSRSCDAFFADFGGGGEPGFFDEGGGPRGSTGVVERDVLDAAKLSPVRGARVGMSEIKLKMFHIARHIMRLFDRMSERTLERTQAKLCVKCGQRKRKYVKKNFSFY